MSIWTTCDLKVERGYGGGHTFVSIPDKRHARQWSYNKQEVDGKYGDLLHSLQTKFIILFTTLTEGGEQWLAKTFKNGLALQYPFEKSIYAGDAVEYPQLHIYPLILLPWFQKKYRKERPEKDPIMFVDGKVVQWTKDVCFNCPQMLERSLKQCSAVHDSCTKPLVDEKNPPTKEWIDAHATATDSIEGFEYRAIKDMAIMHAFEPFTIYSLTVDTDRVKRQKEKRSDAATTAAQSRFVQDVACPQCSLKPWCGGFRHGGRWCKELHLPEDYDYIHEKCEPWMAHVMLLTQQPAIDPRLISAWKGTRAKAYVLRPLLGVPSMAVDWYGKYKNDPRSVVMMRDCNNSPTLSVPYLHVCKLLNVTPISRWDELPPSFKTSKSLRAAAYGLAINRIHWYAEIKSGWGKRTTELILVELVAGKYVKLRYDTNRRDLNHIYRVTDGESFYGDLIGLPGMHYDEGASFSPQRIVENAVFKEAILERRLNVTVEEVKEVCRMFKLTSHKVNEHDPKLYEWLGERSKERCRQKRRSSKQPASSIPGETTTAT